MQEHEAKRKLECFRAFGYFSLTGAACCFLLFMANIRARYYYGAPDFSWLGILAAYAAVVGWGLLRLRRWAVISFSAPLCFGGVLTGISAIIKQPNIRTALLAIAFAALSCLPAVFTIRRWTYLKQPRQTNSW